MKARATICLALVLFFIAPLAFTQSKETGAIVGKITDEEGSGLPGVTVTIASPNLMGTRTATTNAQGEYRVPALPPGEYTVKAELQGFQTVLQENVRLTTTTRLTIDITLKQSAVEEQVTVIAQSPTVDIKSTETASVTLTNELLRNVPYSQFTSSLVNMAPGVTPDNMADSAYGAQDGTGIAYSMDGVNVADPEGGTAWVFVDHNIIEEAKVMGIGLPAEYGNFTGVIFNIVTKSGGNQFSGHMEFDYQGKKDDSPSGFWQQDNNQDYLADFPDFSNPLYKFYDANVHLGGPIKKDKIWFYQGFQFQHFEDYAAGFTGGPRAYDQPRSYTKITAQLTPATNMMFGFEIDTYNGENRGASATTSPDAVVGQKSPEVVTNFSLTHIFSSKTFIDVKAAYFWGYYYLEPKTGRDTYAHFDTDQNLWLYNSGYYYLADRTRFQTNASLTHYAEDFITGNHDFKFGVEVERSTCRSRYGFTGTGGPLGDFVYYTDYWSYNAYYGYNTGNYLAYQYEGYDFNAPYTRLEGFVQDSWQITSRININAGLRYSQNWGQVEGKGTVWNSHRLAPRIGFTFDIFGDKSTIFKAHYGQFTEGMFAAYHEHLTKDWADYISYYWDLANSEWVEYDRVQQKWQLQDGIKHPYMNQYTVSLERELFRDASISVSYIARDFKDIIGVYDIPAVYEAVPYYVDPLNRTDTLYDLVSGSDHSFIIENLNDGPYRNANMGDAYRKYRGLEFLFNKRFSNKWQLMMSYIYSKTTGTIDNGWGDDIGWGGRNSQEAGDPNFWINADGNATFDPTHMLKVQGTYILPWDISFSAYYRAITGIGWAQRYRTTRFGQGRITYYTEKRGSNHMDMQNILDLRLEKIFTLATKYRLGVMLDCFNVFNANTITSWGTRYDYDWLLPDDPDYTPSTDGHDLLGIVNPRQFRLGIRLIF
jgi:Carboxypeptidase regulatory-like domain